MLKKDLKSERGNCKYRMVGELGRGGQAAVVKARRDTDGKHFAIKCTDRSFYSTNNQALNARRWRNTKLEL